MWFAIRSIRLITTKSTFITTNSLEFSVLSLKLSCGEWKFKRKKKFSLIVSIVCKYSGDFFWYSVLAFGSTEPHNIEWTFCGTILQILQEWLDWMQWIFERKSLNWKKKQKFQRFIHNMPTDRQNLPTWGRHSSLYTKSNTKNTAKVSCTWDFYLFSKFSSCCNTSNGIMQFR